jgi:hypothetical protein
LSINLSTCLPIEAHIHRFAPLQARFWCIARLTAMADIASQSWRASASPHKLRTHPRFAQNVGVNGATDDC